MVYVIAMMMMLTALVSIEARTINLQPIISDRDYYTASAIKFNGIYYVVTQIKTLDISNGMFPIHTSTDLIDWKLKGYLFNGSNAPTWAHNTSLESPEIHKIGSNFLLYFSGRDNNNPFYNHIGAAQASHPLGPYTSADRPLLSMPYHTYHPSLIKDQGKAYLMWSSGSEINARELNHNGLSFSSNETITLLKRSLAWEDGSLHNPWYIRRGGFHYLLYYGFPACDVGGMGVARSTDALGPYVKMGNPILASNASNYYCMNDVSIVRDLDKKKSDVIFIIATSGHGYSVLLASLGWNNEDWPYVVQ